MKTRKVISQPVPYSLEKPLALGGGLTVLFEYVQGTFLADEKGVKERAVIEAKKTVTNREGKEVFDPGMALSEFADILRAKGFTVFIKYAGDIAESEFEKDLVNTVDDSSQYLVANFKGDTLGALTGGHISPMAGVSQKDGVNFVLDLDVAGHKNSWYWVPLSDLFKAMSTKDSSSDKTRGYALISDPQKD
jgi:hypothetical protein